MTDVYLHIGLAKTGTTSIQQALQQGAEPLAAHDVAFVLGRHHDQRLAVYDLLGRRVEGSEGRDPAGAWQRLVDAVDASSARAVVVSEELLAVARPRQVRSLARSLDGHRLFVVVGVRDLGRLLPSAWQQEVAKGYPFTWEEFLDAVRDPREGTATAALSFRLRFDLLRILDTWEQAVPRTHVRLVTVPPPGHPPELLLDRFAEAVGLPVGVLRGRVAQANEALGPAEVEVLRRVNLALRPDVAQALHLAAINHAVRPGLAGRSTRRLALPDTERGWVTDRTRALVTELAARGYEVHGDLRDLDPVFASPDERAPDDVTDAELAAATEHGLAETARAYAALWQRHQRLKGRREDDATTRTRLGSSARAVGMGTRMGVMERADDNRLLGWLVRTYARRTSRS